MRARCARAQTGRHTDKRNARGRGERNGRAGEATREQRGDRVKPMLHQLLVTGIWMTSKITTTGQQSVMIHQ